MTETLLPAPPIASPCVGVCVLDKATGWCEGCLRTGPEIAEWRDAGTNRRLDILRSIAVRRARWRRRHDPDANSRGDGRIDDDG